MEATSELLRELAKLLEQYEAEIHVARDVNGVPYMRIYPGFNPDHWGQSLGAVLSPNDLRKAVARFSREGATQ